MRKGEMTQTLQLERGYETRGQYVQKTTAKWETIKTRG